MLYFQLSSDKICFSLRRENYKNSTKSFDMNQNIVASKNAITFSFYVVCHNLVPLPIRELLHEEYIAFHWIYYYLNVEKKMFEIFDPKKKMFEIII